MHSMCSRLSRVRLRVISTRPSGDTDEMWFFAWSLASDFSSACSTCLRCSSSSMSMKSTMMMPPRLRSRSWRAIATAASRLVRKIVSSSVRWPTYAPVLTSIVVIDSVWSKIR